MVGFQPEILAAVVDGSSLSTTVNPTGGLAPGSDYIVSFVKDVNDLDTILAQSGQFDITGS